MLAPPGIRREQTLIAEAKRLQRQRWRRRVLAALITAAVLAAAAAVIAQSRRSASSPASEGGKAPAADRREPPLVVVWTSDFKIDVLHASSGRYVRTLATGVALYQGLPTLTVSSSGVVYFDDSRDFGTWVMSVPLAGGRETRVASGSDPAVSPNGRLLAYLTGRYGPAPVIVVRDLRTGSQRSWPIGWAMTNWAGIDRIDWSPDSRFLAFTYGGGPAVRPRVRLLDVNSGPRARGVPVLLSRTLDWAGFFGRRTGLAVTYSLNGQGRMTSPRSLVEVAIPAGKVLRTLTELPADRLATGNSDDGTEGTITADPASGAVLIASVASDGAGEVFWWAPGMRSPVLLARDAAPATWG